MWVFDGHVVGQAQRRRRSSAATATRSRPTTRSFEWTNDEIHVGAYDPKVRLEVLDECGIDAQIIFPSTIGLGGQDLGLVDDEALRRLAIEIYNDGMAEIQAESGNRLLPLPLMPAWNIDACVAEAKRVAALGARGVNMTSDPAGPRRARPRQPGVGPVLGDVRRAAAAGALPHRGQRHRHDVLRAATRGRRTARTPSWPSAARCCSSATPAWSRT